MWLSVSLVVLSCLRLVVQASYILDCQAPWDLPPSPSLEPGPCSRIAAACHTIIPMSTTTRSFTPRTQFDASAPVLISSHLTRPGLACIKISSSLRLSITMALLSSPSHGTASPRLSIHSLTHLSLELAVPFLLFSIKPPSALDQAPVLVPDHQLDNRNHALQVLRSRRRCRPPQHRQRPRHHPRRLGQRPGPG